MFALWPFNSVSAAVAFWVQTIVAHDSGAPTNIQGVFGRESPAKGCLLCSRELRANTAPHTTMYVSEPFHHCDSWGTILKSVTSKSGSLTNSSAGEPDGVPNWPTGVPHGARYVVPRNVSDGVRECERVVPPCGHGPGCTHGPGGTFGWLQNELTGRW